MDLGKKSVGKDKDKMDRRGTIMSPNLWIVAGTTLMVIGMAIGGLMATYGWNLKTSNETQDLLEQSRIDELELRRKGIITNVVYDVVTNILIIEDDRFTATDEKELSKYVAYPRFLTEALSSVLSSALFYDNKHRPFFEHVNTALTHLTHFNHFLDLDEINMGRIGMTPEKRATLRKKLRDGELRQDAEKKLKKLRDIMLSHYEDLFLDLFESELDEDAKAWTKKYRSQKKGN